MISKTLSQVVEDAMAINIDKPKKNGYFLWHCWRLNCVQKAIIELAVRLFNFGYWVAFGDTWLYAGKDGWCQYLQYMNLEHEYSDMHHNFLNYNEYMEITSSDEELKKFFSIPRKKIDELKKEMKNSSFITEIVK